MNSARAPLIKALRFALVAALALVSFSVCADSVAAVTCKFTTSAMSFGNYDPSSAGVTDGTGSVGVNCTNTGSTATVSVALSVGAGTYGTVASRLMQKSAGQQLNYNLYRDAARTQIWGTGSGGYSTGSISIASIARNASKTGTFTVYGRIPALQNAQAGTYNDSVVITISP